jgi:hypothetical protein
MVIKMHDKTQNKQFVTTDSWKEWSDASYWSNEAPLASMRFQGGDVVFCKIDEVLRLFEQLRLTRKRIILVTGEGDLPCDAFRQSFLPTNVAHWFATNVTCAHSRVTATPLGLGSPLSSITLKENEIAAARGAGVQRDQWLYVNFRPETNPGQRQGPYEHFEKMASFSDWIRFERPSEKGGNKNFLEALVRHYFVLCPPGNGVDTHRMWEVLLAGAVPVVKRSQAMESFSNLPILFVDDFREVTKELLEKASREIRVPEEPLSVMQEWYWKERIGQQRRLAVEVPLMSWREWIAESATYGTEMLARRLGIRRVG